jgi:hypothetical protein
MEWFEAAFGTSPAASSAPTPRRYTSQQRLEADLWMRKQYSVHSTMDRLQKLSPAERAMAEAALDGETRELWLQSPFNRELSGPDQAQNQLRWEQMGEITADPSADTGVTSGIPTHFELPLRGDSILGSHKS